MGQRRCRSVEVGALPLWSPSKHPKLPSRSPLNPNQLLVKRIIALEGDTVKTLPPYPDAEVTVPTGHIWVEGQIFPAFRKMRF